MTSHPQVDFYAQSVPVLAHALGTLDAVLAAGEAFASERGLDEAAVLATRLYPDMLPLAKQIQIAADSAKFCVARLTGAKAPSDADDEATLAQMRARVGRTLAYVNAADPADFAGTGDRVVSLSFPGVNLNYDAATYLSLWAMPNFYFHLTMTYALLRHIGVPVGKMDFLGELPQAPAPQG